MAPALPLERVGDLVHVGRVHGRPEPLVRLVVGDGVAQVLAHPLVVVAEHGLADERELLAALLANLVGKAPQGAKVALVQAVRHVQAKPVDVELAHPAADDAGQVVVELRAPMVELHEALGALPAAVGEAVVPLVVPVPVNLEPARIGALPAALEHVLKGPEAPAHVVEHPVEKNLDASGVARVHHGAQVLVGAEAAVNARVVARVVAVRVRLEHGVEQEARGTELGHVIDPAIVHELEKAVLEHAVVLVRSSAEPQRVHLIDEGRLEPAHGAPLLGSADPSILPARRSPNLRTASGCPSRRPGSRSPTPGAGQRPPHARPSRSLPPACRTQRAA